MQHATCSMQHLCISISPLLNRGVKRMLAHLRAASGRAAPELILRLPTCDARRDLPSTTPPHLPSARGAALAGVRSACAWFSGKWLAACVYSTVSQSQSQSQGQSTRCVHPHPYPCVPPRPQTVAIVIVIVIVTVIHSHSHTATFVIHHFALHTYGMRLRA